MKKETDYLVEKEANRNWPHKRKIDSIDIDIIVSSKQGPLEYPDPMPHNEPLSLTFECEHDPIDVGFNRSKKVCRKCDRDL
jgi:hypothetical protein